MQQAEETLPGGQAEGFDHVDDIHTVLAKRMMDNLREHSVQFQGDPVALLAAVDNYCCETSTSSSSSTTSTSTSSRPTTMMHIGPQKAAFIRDIVKELAPKVCLELGTYCGYSAVLMAAVLPPEGRFLTVESLNDHAVMAKQFVSWAGADVQEKITIINKNSDDVIPALREDFCVDSLDLVFIDHTKSLYLRDLKLLETHGLMRKGTVVLADNMIYPGAPECLEYLQSSSKYQLELIHSKDAYTDREDAVAKAVYLG